MGEVVGIAISNEWPRSHAFHSERIMASLLLDMLSMRCRWVIQMAWGQYEIKKILDLNGEDKTKDNILSLLLSFYSLSPLSLFG